MLSYASPHVRWPSGPVTFPHQSLHAVSRKSTLHWCNAQDCGTAWTIGCHRAPAISTATDSIKPLSILYSLWMAIGGRLVSKDDSSNHTSMSFYLPCNAFPASSLSYKVLRSERTLSLDRFFTPYTYSGGDRILHALWWRRYGDRSFYSAPRMACLWLFGLTFWSVRFDPWFIKVHCQHA